MDKEKLRPWADNRQSLYSWIAAGMVGDSPSRSRSRLTLKELSTRLDILAEAVSPVWENNKDNKNSVFADKIISLISDLIDGPNRENSIRLYQILFNCYFSDYLERRPLEQHLRDARLLESRYVFNYFLQWVLESPDEGPVEFALFVLARTERKPPLDVIQRLAKFYNLSCTAAEVIAKQYGADEDALIQIARLHKGAPRAEALWKLKYVKKPENKQWLLTEGYKNDWGWSSVEPALFHGGLLASLRSSDNSAEMVCHFACCIETLVNAEYLYFFQNDKSGSEYFSLLISHIERLDLAQQLLAQLCELLYFLESEIEERALTKLDYWPDNVLKHLHARYRNLIESLQLTTAERREYLWWEQDVPTVNDVNLEIAKLRDGQIHELHRAVDVVKQCNQDEGLQELVDWATEFLYLKEKYTNRSQRKIELLAIRMPGVCSGGIAGLTDAKLGSVYGQVLLQVIQTLSVAKQPTGKELLIAALETDYPHLPKAASDIINKWNEAGYQFELLPNKDIKG